jgi:ATP-dependent Clp protease ATP-binding subunit ClpX
VPPQGGRKHPEQKLIKINTQNILFICGGAFDGIDRIIARRVQTNTIGFTVDKNEQEYTRKHILQYVNAQDLRGFGLIPELLGRLPVVTHLNALDRDTLKSILVQPKNALIKQYRKLFEVEGIGLQMEDEVIDYIVDKAMEYKLGARGLRSICEAVMTDAMFDMPSAAEKDFVLTLDYAREKLEKSTLARLKVA